MAGSYYNAILRINSQAGDYTAAIADFNSDTIIRMTSASANNFTIPLNASVPFPIGTQLLVVQNGVGQTTIVATGGVTINAVGLKISARYAAATLIQVALNEWDAIPNNFISSSIMKLTDITPVEWTTYVGLLTQEQMYSIVGKEYTTDSYFNPLQDLNDNWIISVEEMEFCTNIDYFWVKDLPLIIYEPIPAPPLS